MYNNKYDIQQVPFKYDEHNNEVYYQYGIYENGELLLNVFSRDIAYNILKLIIDDDKYYEVTYAKKC